MSDSAPVDPNRAVIAGLNNVAGSLNQLLVGLDDLKQEIINTDKRRVRLSNWAAGIIAVVLLMTIFNAYGIYQSNQEGRHRTDILIKLDKKQAEDQANLVKVANRNKEFYLAGAVCTKKYDEESVIRKCISERMKNVP